MALSECLDCGTLLAVGLETCPHCGSVKLAEVGAPKAKGKPKGKK